MPVNPRGRSPIGDPIATPTTPGIMSAAQASQLAPTGAYLDISTATATIDGSYALYGVSYAAAGCTITLDAANWPIGSTRRIEKMNTGAFALTVTPPSGGTINGGSANASLVLPGSSLPAASTRTDSVWFVTRTGTSAFRIAGNVPLSGTYTPTYSAVLNVASVSALAASYVCVGDWCIVRLTTLVTPTASGNFRFSATLPFASNFSSDTHLGGTASCNGYVGECYADATNDVAIVKCGNGTNTPLYCYSTFMFQVIP